MKSNLILRVSKALDFLCHMQRPDGSFLSGFIQGRPIPDAAKMMYQLQTTSMLYSCSKYLEQDHLRKVADQTFAYLNAHKFSRNNEACLIQDGASYGYWNAMMAIILMKRGEMESALPFLQSTKQCFRNGKALAQYLPGTSEDKADAKMPGPVGAISVAFLRANLIDDAVYALNHFIKGKQYDYFDSWALRLLHDKLVEIDDRPALRKTYKDRAKLCEQIMSNVDPRSLTSLVAATTNQAFLSWSDEFGIQDRCKVLLERQMQLQSLDILAGGFIKTEKHPDIMLEYIIHNVIAYLEYLMRHENESLLTPEICI